MHVKAHTNTSASIVNRIGVQKAEDDCSSEIPACFSSTLPYLHNFSLKLCWFRTYLQTVPNLTQSYVPQSQAHVEFCAKRNWVWHGQLYLFVPGSPVSIKTAKQWNLFGRRTITPPPPGGLCYRPAVFFHYLRLIPARKYSARVSKVISCQCFCFWKTAYQWGSVTCNSVGRTMSVYV
jgi:hypothetical protein